MMRDVNLVAVRENRTLTSQSMVLFNSLTQVNLTDKSNQNPKNRATEGTGMSGALLRSKNEPACTCPQGSKIKINYLSCISNSKWNYKVRDG